MKLIANMRINYWLFNFLKSSSKISESSDQNTLKIKIVNSGMLTFTKKVDLVKIATNCQHKKTNILHGPGSQIQFESTMLSVPSHL